MTLLSIDGQPTINYRQLNANFRRRTKILPPKRLGSPGCEQQKKYRIPRARPKQNRLGECTISRSNRTAGIL